MSSLAYPVSHDNDTQAELDDERDEHALKALSPSDIRTAVDEPLAVFSAWEKKTWKKTQY